MSDLSVLQFAMDVLKVRYTSVVGNYCYGCVAAATNSRCRGPLDHWLHPFREVQHDHRSELDAIEDD